MKESILEKLKKKMKDPEFQEYSRKYFLKERQSAAIYSIQVERFLGFLEKRNLKFKDAVEMISQKYVSKSYVNREYKMGFEPRNSLYWFLNSVAEKYGRECSKKEWEKYSNMFSTSLTYYKGYYFTMMQGQGSVINIIPEK